MWIIPVVFKIKSDLFNAVDVDFVILMFVSEEQNFDENK